MDRETNEGINDIIIIKSRKDLGVLIDGIRKIVEYEVKKERGPFAGMLLGTLGATVLSNVLTCRGVIRAGKRCLGEEL